MSGVAATSSLQDFTALGSSEERVFELASLLGDILKRHEEEGIVVEDLAYDFQEAVMLELLDKTRKALNQNDVKHLVLGGGVAANSRLRELILELKNEYPDLKITIPPMWCCTDNAAMIGAVAEIAYRHGVRGTLDVSADPSLSYS